MNRLQQKATGMLLAGMLLSTCVTATELVYTPVNPSFGGSPLNGAWLLGNAQAQNDTKDPDAIDRSSLTGTSALDRFTSQLESRLLSNLLNKMEDPNGGSLITDDFIVNIVNLDGNLTVEITDRLTGEVSEIIVNGYGAIN
ncbi:curli assembly protein CsgF [Pseudomonas sp. SST3]|uniref:curli assembly protein CsgF n=1 Tax=Pseudomonas sp. SST3 TaxID=2267882 RepID=UPI000DFCCD95|nr:curli assembly protein CsgF [Pseudomonas sp. SST3]NKQ09924.1 curli production assembly protein CsgF [Pseudomonas sp. SST3]